MVWGWAGAGCVDARGRARRVVRPSVARQARTRGAARRRQHMLVQLDLLGHPLSHLCGGLCGVLGGRCVGGRVVVACLKAGQQHTYCPAAPPPPPPHTHTHLPARSSRAPPPPCAAAPSSASAQPPGGGRAGEGEVAGWRGGLIALHAPPPPSLPSPRWRWAPPGRPCRAGGWLPPAGARCRRRGRACRAPRLPPRARRGNRQVPPPLCVPCGEASGWLGRECGVSWVAGAQGDACPRGGGGGSAPRWRGVSSARFWCVGVLPRAVLWWGAGPVGSRVGVSTAAQGARWLARARAARPHPACAPTVAVGVSCGCLIARRRDCGALDVHVTCSGSARVAAARMSRPPDSQLAPRIETSGSSSSSENQTSSAAVSKVRGGGRGAGRACPISPRGQRRVQPTCRRRRCAAPERQQGGWGFVGGRQVGRGAQNCSARHPPRPRLQHEPRRCKQERRTPPPPSPPALDSRACRMRPPPGTGWGPLNLPSCASAR